MSELETQAFFEIGPPKHGYELLPPHLQAYTDRDAWMHGEDYQFFEAILRKYGVRHKTSSPDIVTRPFGQTELISALTDVADYGRALRANLDRGFPDGILSTYQDDEERQKQDAIYQEMATLIPSDEKIRIWQKQDDAYQEIETLKLSASRLTDFYGLFLNMPRIKYAYDEFHATKMAGALRYFTHARETTPVPDRLDRLGYFLQTLVLMGAALDKVVSRYDSNTKQAVGDALVYHGFRFRPPYQRKIAMLATVGTGTFMGFLHRAVEEGIEEADLEKRVSFEFSRKGLGHRAMRTSIASFIKVIEPVMQKDGHDAARELMDSRPFPRGRCPASLSRKNPDGISTGENIAYEYAKIILSNMPQRLRQSAT